MKLNKNLKKGSSLIEVIIVLAIVSFTIIASMALVARTRVEIKNNELEENANQVMLKALEALKSPSKVLLSGQQFSLTGVGPYFFSIKSADTTTTPQTTQTGSNPVPEYILTYDHTGTSSASLPKITDSFNFDDICNSNSALFHTEGSFNYCQQVEITPIIRQGKSTIYKVSTTIIYKTSNSSKSDTLTTYRYDGFKKI